SSPILPLASADHGGNVLYIGSLTKSLTTSLRMGYLVASENFIRDATPWRILIDMRGDMLLEEAMAVLFNDGTMQRHLKKSLKLYHERRDLFCNLVKNELCDFVSFDKPEGGMAVWVRFKKKFSVADLSNAVSPHGMYISDGIFYNSGKVNYNALRMGYASLNEKEMTEAVGILKKCVSEM
ncbi:MAG: aminotransferase class I/II-fold pyridoxal phosphate-dependent enzyme, partial [Chitinophagales bacterium]